MARVKGEAPQALRARPIPHEFAGKYIEAFNALSPSRSTGFNNEGSIPVSEILAYCELIGERNEESRRRMLRLVRAMDLAYLEAKGKHGGSGDKPPRRHRVPRGSKRR